MATQFVRRPDAGWLGLDLRAAAFGINPDTASIALNTDVARSSGSLVKRSGSKVACASTSGGLGFLRYAKHSTSTGAETLEKLIVGEQLQRLTTGTFSIAYGGAAASVYVTHLVDASTLKWVFTIYEAGTVVLAYTTSIGFDETAPTLANLKTAIDAVSGFTATITTIATSAPAATSIPSLTGEPFVSGAFSVTCEFLETVNQPTSAANPFANHYASRNSSSFENATYYNVNSCLYINTGTDEQQKYDAQKVYRSGMPSPATSFAAVVGGGGNVDVGAHTYRMFYRQRDKQGNITEGDQSSGATVSPGVTSIINLTLPNIQNTTGFNTDKATVNGNQTAVTTIVVTGSTLKVGDPLTFINRATGALLTTRTVQAGSTATSLIIDGAAVDVNNNDIISAGLTIVVTRTKVGGTTQYVVTEQPNNSGSATSAYADNVADSSLTLIFIPPRTNHNHGLPPKGRYGTVFNGIPVVCGILAASDTAHYGDIDSPEYFPDLNTFDVRTSEQDSFSGLYASESELILFKTRSIHALTGDLSQDDFQIDEVTRRMGCASNSSIVQLADGSIMFLSQRGPAKMLGGEAAEQVGFPVLPLFLQANASTDAMLQLKRCVAYSDFKNESVVFFLPAETTTSGSVAANTQSILLKYDIPRQAWFKWTGLNMAGGAIIDDDSLYWVERRYSTVGSAMHYNIYKRLNNGDIYDYVDHVTAIDWQYEQGWETLGEPSVFKLPLRHKLYAQDPIMPTQFSMTVQLDTDYANFNVSEFTITMGSEGAAGGWGIAPWGVSPWGAPEALINLANLLRKRCQVFRLRYLHSALYESPLITGWEVEAAEQFTKQMKG